MPDSHINSDNFKLERGSLALNRVFNAIEFDSEKSVDSTLKNQLKQKLIFLWSFKPTRDLLNEFVETGYKFKIRRLDNDDKRPAFCSKDSREIVLNSRYYFNAFDIAQELRHFWQFEIVDFNKTYFDKECWATSFFNTHTREADGHAFAHMIYNKAVRHYGENFAKRFGVVSESSRVKKLAFLNHDIYLNTPTAEEAIDCAVMAAGFWQYFTTKNPRDAYSMRCADYLEYFCQKSKTPGKAVLRSSHFLDNYDDVLKAFRYSGVSYLKPFLDLEKKGVLPKRYFASDECIGLKKSDLERIQDEVDLFYKGEIDKIPARKPWELKMLFVGRAVPKVDILKSMGHKNYRSKVKTKSIKRTNRRRVTKRLEQHSFL